MRSTVVEFESRKMVQRRDNFAVAAEVLETARQRFGADPTQERWELFLMARSAFYEAEADILRAENNHLRHLLAARETA